MLVEKDSWSTSINSGTNDERNVTQARARNESRLVASESSSLRLRQKEKAKEAEENEKRRFELADRQMLHDCELGALLEELAARCSASAQLPTESHVMLFLKEHLRAPHEAPSALPPRASSGFSTCTAAPLRLQVQVPAPVQIPVQEALERRLGVRKSGCGQSWRTRCEWSSRRRSSCALRRARTSRCSNSCAICAN